MTSVRTIDLEGGVVGKEGLQSLLPTPRDSCLCRVQVSVIMEGIPASGSESGFWELRDTSDPSWYLLRL